MSKDREAVIIEGSKEEAIGINELVKKWKKAMDEERFVEAMPEIYEQNVTLIVNGHYPVRGIKEAIDAMKLIEEWGPGITIIPDEFLISDSNDFAAVVLTGTYKQLEDFSFLTVFRKTSGRWLAHIDSFHEWVMEKETYKRRAKRDYIIDHSFIHPLIRAIPVEITGNAEAIAEASKLLEEWSTCFNDADLDGLQKLYSEDCVTLANNNPPAKGPEYVKVVFQHMMKQNGKNLISEILGMSTSSNGDMVAAYGTWINGDSFGNALIVQHREDGVLKIRYTNFAHATPM